MDFSLPEIGEGVYEAELVSWLVKVGDTVKRGQELMEVLTDKATMEVPAPFAGTISRLDAQPGQQVKVGQVVLAYTSVGATAETDGARANGSAGEPKAKPREAEAPAARRLLSAAVPGSVKAAPSVRLMARKLGIDLSRVRGTGPEGRILIDDLSRSLPTASAPAAQVKEPGPAFDYGRPGTRIKLVGLRRKIAEHMHFSKTTIPHYTYVDECDVTELVKLRQSLKDRFARDGIKLTYLPFFIKAVVAALKEVPIVNSSLDDKAGEIVLHDRYHIGIAVAAPAGLIVPVLHDADRQTLPEVARQIERLSREARALKNRPEELKGGTFAVTSIGSIGGLIATPIIHHPQTGILAVGKIVTRPVFDAAGAVRPAEMVYLSFSFDHRVIDGAVAAVFGNAVLRQLQSPAGLLLAEKI